MTVDAIYSKISFVQIIARGAFAEIEFFLNPPNLPDNAEKGVYIIVFIYINLNLHRTLFVRFFILYDKF